LGVTQLSRGILLIQNVRIAVFPQEGVGSRAEWGRRNDCPAATVPELAKPPEGGAAEWPAWQGPTLPSALAALLDGGKPYHGAGIVVRYEPVNELIWLRARKKAAG
jgi:hypothetical protein